jgi:hypothetical protein
MAASPPPILARIERCGGRLRDRAPDLVAGARFDVFLAGARFAVRELVPLRVDPARAGVLLLVLLPDDRGGEPAPEVVLALARDRGGEGTRVAMAGEPTPSPHQPHQSRAIS